MIHDSPNFIHDQFPRFDILYFVVRICRLMHGNPVFICIQVDLFKVVEWKENVYNIVRDGNWKTFNTAPFFALITKSFLFF